MYEYTRKSRMGLGSILLIILFVLSIIGLGVLFFLNKGNFWDILPIASIVIIVLSLIFAIFNMARRAEGGFIFILFFIIFLAGLIISETEYSYETMGNIIPFRDVFASIFFISIGMLIDIRFMLTSWQIVLGGGFAIILIKFIIAVISVLLLGFSLRTSILVGFALAQIGEFSFILSKVGYDYKILDSLEYQTILSMSIVTMVFSSFILNYSIPIINKLMQIPLLDWMDKKTYTMNSIAKEPVDIPLEDHLIIIGYGINGRNVSRSARIAGIPYLIIETNPETVVKELAKGERIIYGDASNEEVLKHASIYSARVLVTTVPDAPSARRIIAMARKLNPDVYIIARTRFVKEVNDLFALGASEVIPEEFETSVEIFTRLLKKFNVPENDINSLVEIVRSDGYQMLRTASFESITPEDQRKFIKGLDMITYRVERGSAADGRAMLDLAIRKKYGVTVLAIYRGGDIIHNPDGDAVLIADDVVMLVGMPAQVSGVCDMFKSPVLIE